MKAVADHTKTAVADLAQVIDETEEWVSKRTIQETQMNDGLVVEANRKWEQVLALAESSKGEEMNKVQNELAEVEAKLQTSPEDKALQKSSLELRGQRNSMVKATQVVKAYNNEHVGKAARTRWSQDLTKLLASRAVINSGKKLWVDAVLENARTLQAGPKVKSSSVQAPEDKEAQLQPDYHKQRARNHDAELRSNAIRIRWMDVSDAIWAESWHPKVQHQPLGILTRREKHVFPPSNKLALLEVQPQASYREEAEKAARTEAAKEFVVQGVMTARSAPRPEVKLTRWQNVVRRVKSPFGGSGRPT